MTEQIVLYCSDEEDWGYSSTDIEEAVENALDSMGEVEYLQVMMDNKLTMYRGIRVDQTFSTYFSVRRMIEGMQELASEIGGEWAEDYLTDLTAEQIEDLRKTVVGWADKHNVDPCCFLVKDITEFTFTFPDDWEWDEAYTKPRTEEE